MTVGGPADRGGRKHPAGPQKAVTNWPSSLKIEVKGKEREREKQTDLAQDLPALTDVHFSINLHTGALHWRSVAV